MWDYKNRIIDYHLQGINKLESSSKLDFNDYLMKAHLKSHLSDIYNFSYDFSNDIEDLHISYSYKSSGIGDLEYINSEELGIVNFTTGNFSKRLSEITDNIDWLKIAYSHYDYSSKFEGKLRFKEQILYSNYYAGITANLLYEKLNSKFWRKKSKQKLQKVKNMYLENPSFNFSSEKYKRMDGILWKHKKGMGKLR